MSAPAPLDLAALGWNSAFAEAFGALTLPEAAPARVIREARGLITILGESGNAGELGEQSAVLTGKLRHSAFDALDLPGVGDWVAAIPTGDPGQAVIAALVPRFSRFVRAAPSGERQLLAANVDLVFLVSGLDHDFNLRRIERYLTLAWDSGARPVILLNKADLTPEAAARVQEVEAITPGVPIHLVSAHTGSGLEAVQAHLAPGRTIAFLGSSGVGKSTLVNRLLGAQRQATGEVRDDDSRGRHTTSHRELFLLPEGGCLIDTPGLRELQLPADAGGLERTFADIVALAALCRFNDCAHGAEPGCAIQAALREGALDAARWESYRKLERELAAAARRDPAQRAATHAADRARFRAQGKRYKAIQKAKGRE